MGWPTFRFFGGSFTESAVGDGRLEQEACRRLREAETAVGGCTESWGMAILAPETLGGKRRTVALCVGKHQGCGEGCGLADAVKARAGEPKPDCHWLLT